MTFKRKVYFHPSLFSLYFILLFILSHSISSVTSMQHPVNGQKKDDSTPRIDYSESTETNFATAKMSPIVGKYAFIRKLLDYSYHKYYSPERQYLHDFLIDQSGETIIYDSNKNQVCDKPAGGNWIVFTAGAFGAGKSHVLSWLSKRGLFPLQSFVVVDPDHLREKLPETQEYIRRDPSTAGYMTQKEVGYISEVMILKTLLEGRNVIVDGSLKDSEWYCQYMLKLRNTFPLLKLAIIHVVTTLETAVSRAARRGAETGREVPLEAIAEQLETIPQSLKRLQPYVNYVATFRNEEIPELIYSSPGETSLSAFREVWAMSCRDEGGADMDMEVCPDNLQAWKQNNYYRLFPPPTECCRINSAL
jgi:hypothetical protein